MSNRVRKSEVTDPESEPVSTNLGRGTAFVIGRIGCLLPIVVTVLARKAAELVVTRQLYSTNQHSISSLEAISGALLIQTLHTHLGECSA